MIACTYLISLGTLGGDLTATEQSGTVRDAVADFVTLTREMNRFGMTTENACLDVTTARGSVVRYTVDDELFLHHKHF